MKQIAKVEPGIVQIKENMFKLEKETKPPENKQVKQDMLSNMDIIEQVVNQVQCQVCGNFMSSKNLIYNHAAYCVKNVQEVDEPKARPMPKEISPNLKNILPNKGVKQYEESADDEAELVKGCSMTSERKEQML